jgi:parallel beta-helix repeat protein
MSVGAKRKSRSTYLFSPAWHNGLKFFGFIKGARMLEKRMISFAAGVFFFGAFCWITSAPGHARVPSEVVFIDPSVQDAATIEAHLPKGAEVVRLSPEMDGIAQISAHLAGKADLCTIRIISHGNGGHFVLNGKRIDRDFLRAHGDRVTPWVRALCENGDILLYGCDVGAGDKGAGFMSRLAALTGADVAASTNATGAESLGGDWELEYTIGTVEAVALECVGFNGLLATNTYYVDPSGTDDGSHGSGPGSDAWQTIQYAVNNAANPKTDTNIINVSGDTYTLTAEIGTNRSFGETSGGLTIQGAGAASTIVQANASKGVATERVFNLYGVITLKDMTIRHGRLWTGSGGGAGIRIDDGETITIDSCTIADNVQTDLSTGDGAGIWLSSSSSLTITNSTIEGNSTLGDGGGIYVRASAGSTCTITNCTISGNTSGDDGGGLYIAGSATVELTNVTIAENSATGDGDGIAINAAGSYDIKNSLLANNGTEDFYLNTGSITDSGYNLVENSSGYTWTGTGDITGQDPLLGALGDWGGSTQTLPLCLNTDPRDSGACNGVTAGTSPAINVIPTSSGQCGGSDPYNVDQRGVARPYSSSCDIGAYERTGTTLVELVSFTATGFEDSILLTWHTASEIDTAGFHLWRSETEDGEYVRITDSLIPAEGNPTSGARYEYEDLDVEPGRTYYYKLEDINTDGVHTFHAESVTLRRTTADPEASPASGAGGGCFIDSVTHNH